MTQRTKIPSNVFRLFNSIRSRFGNGTFSTEYVVPSTILNKLAFCTWLSSFHFFFFFFTECFLLCAWRYIALCLCIWSDRQIVLSVVRILVHNIMQVSWHMLNGLSYKNCKLLQTADYRTTKQTAVECVKNATYLLMKFYTLVCIDGVSESEAKIVRYIGCHMHFVWSGKPASWCTEFMFCPSQSVRNIRNKKWTMDYRGV